MKKWTVLLVLLCIVALAGCSRTPAKVDTLPTEWKPEPPAPRDLTALLTAAEVSEAVGVPMEDGAMEEGGEILAFHSADYGVQVSLLLEEEPVGGPEAYLDAVLAGYGEGSLISAPNLGTAAYWCADTGELLVRDETHVLSVNLMAADMSGERMLLAARQLAAKVLERL